MKNRKRKGRGSKARKPAPSLADLAVMDATSIDGFCLLTDSCRAIAYQEIAAGRLEALKVGRRTIVTREARQRWLANRPAFASKSRPTERDGAEAA